MRKNRKKKFTPEEREQIIEKSKQIVKRQKAILSELEELENALEVGKNRYSKRCEKLEKMLAMQAPYVIIKAECDLLLKCINDVETLEKGIGVLKKKSENYACARLLSCALARHDKELFNALHSL